MGLDSALNETLVGRGEDSVVATPGVRHVDDVPAVLAQRDDVLLPVVQLHQVQFVLPRVEYLDALELLVQLGPELLQVGALLGLRFGGRPVVVGVGRSLGRDVLERSRAELERSRPATDGGQGDVGYEVLVAIPADADRERERQLLVTASAAATKHRGNVYVVQFEEVPDQVPLSHASSVRRDVDEAFEARTNDLASEFDVDITVAEVVSHDVKRAIVNHARQEGSDLLLLERESSLLGTTLPANELDWVVRHAPCDVMLLDGVGGEEISDVAVVTTQGTYDPAKVRVADDIAVARGGTVTILYDVARTAPPGKRETIAEYLAELAASCRSPVATDVRPLGDGSSIEEAIDADLVIVGPQRGSLGRRLLGWPKTTTGNGLDAPVIEVHTREPARPGVFRRVAERLFF